MLKKITVWQIWSLALGLILFDLALILAFIGPTSVLGTSDEADWDFRITELRQLDATPPSAVAGVSVSRDTIEAAPMISATPTPSPTPVLPHAATPTISPLLNRWQLPFDSLFGTQGATKVDN